MMENRKSISIEIRGNDQGVMEVSTEADFSRLCATVPTGAGAAPLTVEDGVHPLFFRFRGDGTVDFLAFTLL